MVSPATASTPVERNRWLVVAATGAGVFMAQLDATVVLLALPVLEHEFHIETTATQWVVLGYVLPLIALTLPAGRWLDRLDRRTALLASTAGFAAASALAGSAPTLGWLLGARVLQGVCAAVLFALLPVLTTTAVAAAARGRAMGIVMTVGTLGGVCGPALGGVLIETVGWRWIFFVNVPVSLAVIAIGAVQVPRDGRLLWPGGAALVDAALVGGAALVVLTTLHMAAAHGPTWIALGLVVLPLLLVWRALPISRPVRDLLRIPGVRGCHVALLGGVAAVTTVLFLAPFHLQLSGVRPAVAGLVLLAFPAAVVPSGIVAGLVVDRCGPRRVAVVGALLTCLGAALLVPLGPGWTVVDLAWRLVVLGVGSGVFATANQTLAMALAPRRALGTIAASTSVTRQIGTSVGPATATAAWSLTTDRYAGTGVALAIGTGLAACAVLALARPGAPGAA